MHIKAKLFLESMISFHNQKLTSLIPSLTMASDSERQEILSTRSALDIYLYQLFILNEKYYNHNITANST